MKRHLRLECGVPPQFKCPHCEYVSNRKGNINAHIAIKHAMPWSDSARPHRCRCGKQYSNLGTMVRHQREECGRDPHHCCQLCNYRSHRKDTLDRHVRLKHQKMPEIVQVVMNHCLKN
ncbi:zinc finger X-chromosomal protein-like [Homalodisca vitripennis]|uniref:zinc finger X-chromosomal protein-like n=1 Tax=Homalodisca vitripennis TaxID=197043 RepID=UPI001EEC607E|nr:zinc finger X-chromosomal protein-like [Homalodisca vitripennis]